MDFSAETTFYAGFLKELAEISHASPHTVRAYEIDLQQAFGVHTETMIPPEDQLLQKVKQAQIKWGGMALSTRQRKAATMKAFLDWLYTKRYISSPLNEKIEAPKVPRSIPHFLSIDEVLQVFAAAKTLEQSHSKRASYLALLYLLYGGGLRISEACRLRWDRIRYHSEEICILGKGNKERWVALPQGVLNAVRDLPQTGDYIWGAQPLDVRVGFNWIRKLGQRAGLLTPLNPHALRHSYATHLVTSGINLRSLQELMGHASLSATEKYLHLSMDQLARTVDSHHPLGDGGRGKIRSPR